MLSSAYFTTESYPAHRRLSVWRETLERLSLHVRKAPEAAMRGTVASAISPQGMTFASISSGPQELGYQQATRSGAICLTLHLEGEAILVDEARRTTIDSGDIVFGPTGATGGMSLKSDFRQLLVTIPREAFRSRLPTPMSLKVGRLAGHSGIGHIFSGMLGSVADRIEQLTVAQLRPIEVALSEFLVCNLSDADSPRPEASGVSSHSLHRISQHIETRLGDPQLTVASVADQIGVSIRYLQKLFECAGETFTHYVRLRRLERCRADLVNPLFAHLSISDICFRWNFNDAAHFSRAFREQYHVSPRVYRREVGSTISKKVLLHANRHWPGEQQHSDAPVRKSLPLPLPQLQRLPLSAAFDHQGLAGQVRPVMQVASGGVIAIETLSAHWRHEYEYMYAGDVALAGMLDSGRCETFSGPIAVSEAQVGDVIEVRILDIQPRKSANPRYRTRSFGCHVRAQTATIYELTSDAGLAVARPAQSDERLAAALRVQIPLQPHFGSVRLAASGQIDDSFDDPRVEKGSKLYLPVRVVAGLLSIGLPRASATIDASLTGVFQIILHRGAVIPCPLLETGDEWVVHAKADIRAGLDDAILEVQQKLFEFLCRTKNLGAREANALLAVAMEIEVRKTECAWCVQASLKRASVIGDSDAGTQAEQQSDTINAC